MRLVKMFGLCVITAVAAMALVGTTSAMAESTALCEEDTAELGCEEALQASHVHFNTPSGEPAHVLSTTVNIVCDTLYLGDTLELGSPLVIHGNFTYSNCKREGTATSCSAKELSSDSLLELLKTGTELGTVSTEFEVLFECPLIFHCVFNGTGQKWTAVGPLHEEPGESKTTLNKVRGLLCPKTAVLDIWLEPLTALYIRN